MPAPGELLAASLEELHKVQKDGVVRSSEISRVHRERLIRNGFLMKVVKGWLIITNPSMRESESTAWYASYWSFVRRYLSERFSSDYCLSPEASIKRHTGATVIPSQLIVITKKKGAQTLSLPSGTSMLLYQDKRNLPVERVKKDGLWILDLPAALCKAQPSFFKNNPYEAEIALRMVSDPSQLLRILLDKGGSAAAGRIAGACMFLGEDRFAKRIINGMAAAGYKIRPVNPFERHTPVPGGGRITSPYMGRIEAMWMSMRRKVADIFPAPPGIPADRGAYLKKIDEIFVNDAYNSLSIEGYKVTRELIERVRAGKWNPDKDENDKNHREALAAKGYSLAFNSVKASIGKILKEEDASQIVEADHHVWFTHMFSPSVQAGILRPSDLAGYRNDQVYIRGSYHVPPPKEAITDCMDALFNMIKKESHAGVRAVMGHFIFVFIHPYTDGNGRIGRFLMNALLASGGYPWTVIRLERRREYMTALEDASVKGHISRFARFIKDELKYSSQLQGRVMPR